MGSRAAMYRPGAFAIDDIAVLHETIRRRVFATLATIVDGAVTFAYAPVIPDAATDHAAEFAIISPSAIRLRSWKTTRAYGSA